MRLDPEAYAKFEEALGRAAIPGHMIVPLYRWVTKGVRPGGFLEAVIALDWRAAILAADFINRAALKDFVILMDDMPPGSTGAPFMSQWEKQHGRGE